MKRERPVRDWEKLRPLLVALNQLGYPPRPPPTTLPDPSDQTFADADGDQFQFTHSLLQPFHDEDLNQIPPDWED
jgi:hypothetical protein